MRIEKKERERERGGEQGGREAACWWGLRWWLEKPFGRLEPLCGSQLFELKLSTEEGRSRGSPSNILATQSARLSQQQKSQRRRQSAKERQRRKRRMMKKKQQQQMKRAAAAEGVANSKSEERF